MSAEDKIRKFYGDIGNIIVECLMATVWFINSGIWLMVIVVSSMLVVIGLPYQEHYSATPIYSTIISGMVGYLVTVSYLAFTGSLYFAIKLVFWDIPIALARFYDRIRVKQKTLNN